MNNLYRELAPVNDAAWADMEQEARRTFERHVAARRAVDVTGPDGPLLASVNTGHLTEIQAPADGVIAHSRESRPLVRLRVPFTVSRDEVDAVERGAQDADWQPVKDAAKKIAFAEDRAVFEGYQAASITGIRQSTSNPALTLPAEAWLRLLTDDYVGLDYTPESLDSLLEMNPLFWPPSEGYGQGGLMRIADPNQLPEITDKLMDRGWAEADIRKLLGGNFLRVASAVWK